MCAPCKEGGFIYISPIGHYNTIGYKYIEYVHSGNGIDLFRSYYYIPHFPSYN